MADEQKRREGRRHPADETRPGDDQPVLPGRFFSQMMVVAFLLVALIFFGFLPSRLSGEQQLRLVPTATPGASPTVTPTATERPIRVFLPTPTPAATPNTDGATPTAAPGSN
jgi:hypothetical protein